MLRKLKAYLHRATCPICHGTGIAGVVMNIAGGKTVVKCDCVRRAGR